MKPLQFMSKKHGSRCLLGKTTAISLGVLKIRLEINAVEQLPIKDYVVDLQMSTL